MKSILSLFVFAAVIACADRPNIIVIYTDDQGYGDASCLDPKAKFKTPNLDRLAKEGIAFTNGHPVNYAPKKVFESPFLNADWNSGIVTISKGDRKKVLNFESSPPAQAN